MNTMTTYPHVHRLHSRSLAVTIYCVYNCTGHYKFWMFTFLNITTIHSQQGLCICPSFSTNLMQVIAESKRCDAPRFRARLWIKDDSHTCSDWLHLESDVISILTFTNQLCVLLILDIKLQWHLEGSSNLTNGPSVASRPYFMTACRDTCNEHLLHFRGFVFVIRRQNYEESKFIFSNQHMLIMRLWC
jgi:hypothetical protein